MKHSCVRAVAACVAAALFLSVPVQAEPGVSARSAILMDAASGEVLFEKNADQKSLIASTTKIMTGLLVAESGNLDEQVSIPEQATGIEGSSLYLKAGEVLTVRQLLYGMMLHSGNDAAVALAMAEDGSVERFVERMNARAAELGLVHTHFSNPNGLDDPENYSTARDLAALACAAMANETFRQVVSTKSITVGGHSLSNHNKLLWSYDGAVGVKTGFTKAAGRLLVSAAERGGRRLVAVTIDAPDDWNDHAAILDYGFSQYTEQTLVHAGQMLGSAPVIAGTAGAARCAAAQTVTALLWDGEKPEVRICVPRMIFAPVTAGQPAGYAEFRIGKAVIGTVPLCWQDTVALAPEKEKKRGLLSRLFGGA